MSSNTKQTFFNYEIRFSNNEVDMYKTIRDLCLSKTSNYEAQLYYTYFGKYFDTRDNIPRQFQQVAKQKGKRRKRNSTLGDDESGFSDVSGSFSDDSEYNSSRFIDNEPMASSKRNILNGKAGIQNSQRSIRYHTSLGRGSMRNPNSNIVKLNITDDKKKDTKFSFKRMMSQTEYYSHSIGEIKIPEMKIITDPKPKKNTGRRGSMHIVKKKQNDLSEAITSEIQFTKNYIQNNRGLFKGPSAYLERELWQYILDNLERKYKNYNIDDIIFVRRKSCECLGCGKCCKKLKKTNTKNINEQQYDLIVKEAIQISCKDGNYENFNLEIPDFLKAKKKIHKHALASVLTNLTKKKLETSIESDEPDPKLKKSQFSKRAIPKPIIKSNLSMNKLPRNNKRQTTHEINLPKSQIEMLKSKTLLDNSNSIIKQNVKFPSKDITKNLVPKHKILAINSFKKNKQKNNLVKPAEKNTMLLKVQFNLAKKLCNESEILSKESLKPDECSPELNIVGKFLTKKVKKNDPKDVTPDNESNNFENMLKNMSYNEFQQVINHDNNLPESEEKKLTKNPDFLSTSCNETPTKLDNSLEIKNKKRSLSCTNSKTYELKNKLTLKAILDNDSQNFQQKLEKINHKNSNFDSSPKKSESMFDDPKVTVKNSDPIDENTKSLCNSNENFKNLEKKVEKNFQLKINNNPARKMDGLSKQLSPTPDRNLSHNCNPSKIILAKKKSFFLTKRESNPVVRQTYKESVKGQKVSVFTQRTNYSNTDNLTTQKLKHDTNNFPNNEIVKSFSSNIIPPEIILPQNIKQEKSSNGPRKISESTKLLTSISKQQSLISKKSNIKKDYQDSNTIQENNQDHTENFDKKMNTENSINFFSKKKYIIDSPKASATNNFGIINNIKLLKGDYLHDILDKRKSHNSKSHNENVTGKKNLAIFKTTRECNMFPQTHLNKNQFNQTFNVQNTNQLHKSNNNLIETNKKSNKKQFPWHKGYLYNDKSNDLLRKDQTIISQKKLIHDDLKNLNDVNNPNRLAKMKRDLLPYFENHKTRKNKTARIMKLSLNDCVSNETPNKNFHIDKSSITYDAEARASLIKMPVI